MDKFDAQEFKCQKWNSVESKGAIDDAIKYLMDEVEGFKQDHFHVDVKILIGLCSALIAGLTAFYHYKVPFYESNHLLVLAACVLYFGLNAFYLFYVYYIEQHAIYVGRKSQDTKVIIASNVDRFDCKYKLKIKMQAAGVSYPEQQHIALFSDYVDEEGHVVGQLLLNDLRSLMAKVSSSSNKKKQ
ncbi:hypothetical protein MIR68_008669 [Amoeboaphelidium protococcarum]|nr:hypothetical protein MIR68_008669 [Amoeboaphelidium protococcarum]